MRIMRILQRFEGLIRERRHCGTLFADPHPPSDLSGFMQLKFALMSVFKFISGPVFLTVFITPTQKDKKHSLPQLHYHPLTFHPLRNFHFLE